MKTWNHKDRFAFFFSSSLFSFQKQPPKIILETSCFKISQNSIGKPAVDFVLVAGRRPLYLLHCVACCLWNFEAVISKYLRLIAAIKSSQRRCSIKKVFLKDFAIFTGKHLCWSPQACDFITKRLQHWCFPVNFENFENSYFENICKWLLCVTLFIYHHFQNSYRIIFSCSAFVTTRHILRNISR